MKPAHVPIRRCKTLADVRREIDRLDRRIVRLLSERGGYVGEAARIKENAAQIVDRTRIEAIIEKVRNLSTAYGGDPDTVERIYRAMIDAYIVFERRAFAKKKASARKAKAR